MKTLHELVARIRSYDEFRGIEDVVQAEPWLAAYTGTDWRDHFDLFAAGRKSLTVFQDEKAKLTLIRWDGYARSSKHGHPDRGCLLKVLAGVLLETRYDPLEPAAVAGKYHLFKGGMAFIHDALAFHVVENPSPFPAVSLHLYAPGIYTSRIIEPVGSERRPGRRRHDR